MGGRKGRMEEKGRWDGLSTISNLILSHPSTFLPFHPSTLPLFQTNIKTQKI